MAGEWRPGCCWRRRLDGAADTNDAIVKIYTVHNRPDYWNPWSMRGPQASSGSGCVIKGRRILTNAHVVGDQTFIQVRRNGEAKRWRRGCWRSRTTRTSRCWR
jgi:S1-C subfamily serine protease